MFFIGMIKEIHKSYFNYLCNPQLAHTWAKRLSQNLDS